MNSLRNCIDHSDFMDLTEKERQMVWLTSSEGSSIEVKIAILGLIENSSEN